MKLVKSNPVGIEKIWCKTTCLTPPNFPGSAWSFLPSSAVSAEEQLRAAAASPWSDDVLHQHCSVSQTPQKLHTRTKKQKNKKTGEHANLSKIKAVTVLVTCSFSSTAPMFDQWHLFSPEDQLTQLYYLGLSVWCKYSLQLTAERGAA